MEIILASASPRRQELLKQIGCRFSVAESNYTEDNSLNLVPHELVVKHALAKAKTAACKMTDETIIIGADTIVVFNKKIYGKPINAKAARKTLAMLSGNTHQVITGIAVVRKDRYWTDYAVTSVTIRKLTYAEIEAYIKTKEPLDKAGAYGIQGIGALLVESILGCYTNVVGLPLVNLLRLLKNAGVELL